MDKLFLYFHKLRHKYPDIDYDLKAILSQHTSPENAISMSEIRAAYKARKESAFPIKIRSIAMAEFLLTIPYVAAYCNENGTLFFYTLR